MGSWAAVTDRSDAPRADQPDPVAVFPTDDAAPTRPKGLGLLAGVVTLCLVASAAFGVWAWRSAGDEDVAGSGVEGMDHTDHHSSDQAHEGHVDSAVLEGCDPDAMHASMMMFDPFVADGLLESGCAWPYSADIVIAGGIEDPSIAAVFEPRRYAEVFDLLAVDRLGMCSVSRLPDPAVDGFVFGFRTQLHPESCAGGVASVQLDVREYATRAWRDTAAHAAAGDGSVAVLGRWVITTSGDDSSASAALGDSIAALAGAAVVSA